MSEYEKIEALVRIRKEVNYKIAFAKNRMKEFRQAQGRTGKRVIKTDLQGNRLAEYPSISKASQLTGIDPKLIRSVCNGLQPKTNGVRFRYVN